MVQQVLSKVSGGYTELPSIHDVSQAIEKGGERIYQALPSVRQVAHNVSKVTKAAAKPFACLLFLDLVTGAQGGPLLYAVCVADCVAMSLGAGALGPCEAACLPVLALPTP